VDDVIAAEARAFEVLGLQTDKSYKFRLAFVLITFISELVTTKNLKHL
jgi:hypothetical protein